MTEDQGFRIGDLRSIVKRRLPIMAAVSGTVFLLAIFAIAVAWVFRPGSSYQSHAEIPFRHDEDRVSHG